ncbi:MAG: hypothetical protein ACJA0X_000904 [Cyclobacteriaceae bacterium]
MDKNPFKLSEQYLNWLKHDSANILSFDIEDNIILMENESMMVPLYGKTTDF